MFFSSISQLYVPYRPHLCALERQDAEDLFLVFQRKHEKKQTNIKCFKDSRVIGFQTTHDRLYFFRKRSNIQCLVKRQKNQCYKIFNVR